MRRVFLVAVVVMFLPTLVIADGKKKSGKNAAAEKKEPKEMFSYFHP